MAGDFEEHEVEVLLREGALLINDGYRAKNSELSNTGIPFARAGNIDGGFHFENADRVPEDTLAKVGLKRSLPGDVVFTSKGTVGRFAFVRDGTPEFVYSPQLCYWRSCDVSRIHPRWLFYWMNGREFFLQFKGAAGQTDMAEYVSLRDQRAMRITLPPLAEQKAIAAVLGALDDKIELNRQMNATLEAMARALFQSWFVDFDPVRAKLDGRPPAALDPATAALFPASFQESALGPIPHGWRAAHLEEIASIGSGKRPDGRCDVLSPECNIPLYGGGGRMGYVPSALYDRPILFTGRVGTLGLIFRTAEPSWPSDNTLIVEPQAGLFDFTYFVLKGFDLIRLNRGSTQPLLTQTDLKRQTLVLPTKNVVKAFADVSEPIFRQMVSNERESRALATLRDTLLPNLLSGELSVQESTN
jgi:type I restriction enzyme S subunit